MNVFARLLVLVLLTKLVTTPMRVGGAVFSLTGALISFVPVVGNLADEGLEKVDEAIDVAADTVDEVPI